MLEGQVLERQMLEAQALQGQAVPPLGRRRFRQAPMRPRPRSPPKRLAVPRRWGSKRSLTDRYSVQWWQPGRLLRRPLQPTALQPSLLPLPGLAHAARS